MWHSCESGVFFVLSIMCSWCTGLRAPEEPWGSGSPGKLRFMAFGVHLLLAAVYLTARYCTAQQLINTVVKFCFLENSLERHCPGFGGSAGGKHPWSSLAPRVKSIYYKPQFDFFEPVFPSFPGALAPQLPQGLSPSRKQVNKALHKSVRVSQHFSGWWRGRVCNNKSWALPWLRSIAA